MKIAAVVLLLAACGATTAPAKAEGNAERGKTIAYSCLGCHGIDGYRNAYPSYRVPKLGGQKASYLVAALRGYRDGARRHATMEAQASSLSDRDIDDVAAYLATLNNDTVAGGGTQGVSFDKAATCIACHGQNGISSSPAWPTLADQHEDYLVHALGQYRSGERRNAVMMPMATGLSDADIKALAAYYAGLEGLETTVKE
jgi:cytochrome c553